MGSTRCGDKTLIIQLCRNLQCGLLRCAEAATALQIADEKAFGNQMASARSQAASGQNISAWAGFLPTVRVEAGIQFKQLPITLWWQDGYASDLALYFRKVRSWGIELDIGSF